MKYLILLVFLLAQTLNYAQCPTQAIHINTQDQIDSFPINYLNCTELKNNLFISGNTILNLDGLSQLTKAITLSLDQTHLTNVKGLQNISSYQKLSISRTLNLKSLYNLKSINHIDTLFLYKNKDLESLPQLNNLTEMESVYLSKNKNLKNLIGLKHLERIDEIFVNECASIKSLEPFYRIKQCNSLTISNLKISAIKGFSKLKELDYLNIISNKNLSNIKVFFNLDKINLGIKLIDNRYLSNCEIPCSIIAATPTKIFSNNGFECPPGMEQCSKNIFGLVFIDTNKNKVKDDDEVGVPNILARENEYGFWQITDRYGQFYFDGSPGKTYQIMPKIDTKKWALTTDSSSYTFVAQGMNTQFFSFGLYPINNEPDVKIYLPPIKDGILKIIVQNEGPDVSMLTLRLKYSPRIGAFFTPNPNEKGEIKWNIPHMKPFEKIVFQVALYNDIPDPDTQILSCEVIRDSDHKVLAAATINEYKKYRALDRPWTSCDLKILPQGTGKEHYVKADTTFTFWLEPDDKVRNILATTSVHSFDPNSFEIGLSSHISSVKISNGMVRLHRSNQYLKADITPYFVFRLHTLPGLSEGQHIITSSNTVSTIGTSCTTSTHDFTVTQTLLKQPESLSQELTIIPNPTNDFFSLVQANSYHELGQYIVEIFDASGHLIKAFDKEYHVEDFNRYDISDLESGIYFVHIRNKTTFQHAVLIISP